MNDSDWFDELLEEEPLAAPLELLNSREDWESAPTKSKRKVIATEEEREPSKAEPVQAPNLDVAQVLKQAIAELKDALLDSLRERHSEPESLALGGSRFEDVGLTPIEISEFSLPRMGNTSTELTQVIEQLIQSEVQRAMQSTWQRRRNPL